MIIFNAPRHFFGLDYIHDKTPKMTFRIARSHDLKLQKFNFQANFECLYISMLKPAHGF